MPSLKKIQTVQRLTQTLEKSANCILVTFGSVKHQKFEVLRKKLRERKHGLFQVVKNSLLQIAARKAGKKAFTDEKILQGSSALLTLPQEWMPVLSSVYQFFKTEGALSFKIGILDGVAYQKDDLIKLAQLPSKETLMGKIIAAARSPHTRVVYSMKHNMTKLIHVIKGINPKS